MVLLEINWLFQDLDKCDGFGEESEGSGSQNRAFPCSLESWWRAGSGENFHIHNAEPWRALWHSYSQVLKSVSVAVYIAACMQL